MIVGRTPEPEDVDVMTGNELEPEYIDIIVDCMPEVGETSSVQVCSGASVAERAESALCWSATQFSLPSQLLGSQIGVSRGPGDIAVPISVEADDTPTDAPLSVEVEDTETPGAAEVKMVEDEIT